MSAVKAKRGQSAVNDVKALEPAVAAGNASGKSARAKALPWIAAGLMVATVGAAVSLGRGKASTKPAVDLAALTRQQGEPTPVQDIDHYVQGSPPAVAERFLRAWMRARYDVARDLSTGALRTRCEQKIAQVGAFTSEQMEELRRTRAYTEAAHYDLEHVEMRDLPPAPNGNPRKEVRAQAHAYGTFPGTRMDSRRGQTFVMELVDGSWRVAERTWETFERERPAAGGQ